MSSITEACHEDKSPLSFSDISNRQTLILVSFIIAISTILRLLFANSIGFGVDETYYLAMGRDSSLSYLDHPPLTFWISNIITAINNIPSPLFGRTIFVLLTVFLQLLLFDFCVYLFSNRAAIYTLIIYNITPAIGLTNGTWILPDGPLLLTLLACSCLLVRVFLPSNNPGRNFRLYDVRLLWTLAGVFFGLACLSKYHAPIWLLGVFAYMVFSSYARFWLPKPHPWIALFIAFLFSLPVLIWNFQNDWASFAFQMFRALPSGDEVNTGSSFPDFTALFVSFFTQSLWLSPWIFLLLWYASLRALIFRTAETNFCLFLGLPIVLFFTLITLVSGEGLPHWQMPGYFFLLPLVGNTLARIHNQQLLVSWVLFAVLVFVVSIFLAVVHTKYGTFSRYMPTIVQLNDPTLDTNSWHELKEPLNTYLATDKEAVIITTNWIDAVKIDFITGGQRVMVLPFSDPRHFAYRYSLDQMKHRSAFLVASVEDMRAVSSVIKRFYKTTLFLETIALRRGKQTFGNMEIWYLVRP